MPNFILNQQTPDTDRLYDMLTRQQVYIEGVKLHHANEFRKTVRKLTEEFRYLFGRINYKTLDGLTKRELTMFIVTLRKSQNRIYSAYVERLLKDIYAFMKVDKRMTLRMYGALVSESDIVSLDESMELVEQAKRELTTAPFMGWRSLEPNDNGDSFLWSKILNSPIPANGLLTASFINAFSKSAQASVENEVRRAWANKDGVSETLLEITRDKGVLDKVFNQNTAVTSTVIQHIAQTVGASVASVYTGRYRWDSVMDSVTTFICRTRNGNIYNYGAGPLPPAHIRCRSRTTPVFGSGNPRRDQEDIKFYDWLVQQPKSFLTDVYDADTARKILSGSADRKDFIKYRATKPLTLSEYESKIDEILKR